jgi:hypothetical protein
MYIRIFPAGAVAQVYGELEHGKPILQQFLAEQSVLLTLLFGLRRQVEKYQYPQNPIFIKAHNQCANVPMSKLLSKLVH